MYTRILQLSALKAKIVAVFDLLLNNHTNYWYSTTK